MIDHILAGSVRVLDGVTNEVLERKIQTLRVYGNILCRQEHALVIKTKLADRTTMTVVPAGHRLVEGDLTLDALTLQTLESERLFCMGDVIIGADVESRDLDRAVARLQSLGAILCPDRIKDVLKTKCDMLDNRVILYKGTLWYVDSERQLVPDQFDFVEDPVTIVVRAELTITKDVSSESILKQVAKIHNLGEIYCESHHVAAIEARLGIREGDLEVLKKDEPVEDDEGPTLGNGNIMTL